MKTGKWLAVLLAGVILCHFALAADEPIDFGRARELMQRRQQGQTLTADEQQYLQRAIEARRASQPATRPASPPAMVGKASMGLKPLTEMSAQDTYKGEDGGLYGEGRNEPPAAHAEAARRQIAQIRPLDAEGKPSPEGKIVLMSIGMSNTTQEFSAFMRLARSDTTRRTDLVIVDGALGAQDVAAWAESKRIPQANNITPWDNAMQKLKESGVTPQQVQVIWLKQAKMGPASDGAFPAHARKLADGEATILKMAQEKYPNLRIAYLSSRIYAGYATRALNPEPYAYESAFAVRWLIEEQIKGDAKFNYDPAKGPVKSPLLLWGPYLWADGTTPRKDDGLVWNREDLGEDGTHPSSTSGMAKVGQMLLKFFQTDELARGWYLAEGVGK